MGLFYCVRKFSNNQTVCLKKAFLITVALLFFSSYSFSQSNGDFRSRTAGDWNSTSTWEQRSGSSWVAATSYPGQSSADKSVTVLHNVLFNVSHAYSILNLTVDDGAILTSADTPTLYVTGNVTLIPNTVWFVFPAPSRIDFGSGNLYVSGSIHVGYECVLNFGGTLTSSGTVTLESRSIFLLGTYYGQFQNNGNVTLLNTSSGVISG